MLDIVAALEWVNQHISAFGGDPNNVMIFGESGGGAKTSCLYAMPEAAPYFHKASIESGPGVRMLTREMATETTALVLKELNIAPKDWRKLLDVPRAELLRIQSQCSPIPPYRQKSKTGGRASSVPVVLALWSMVMSCQRIRLNGPGVGRDCREKGGTRWRTSVPVSVWL